MSSVSTVAKSPACTIRSARSRSATSVRGSFLAPAGMWVSETRTTFTSTRPAPSARPRSSRPGPSHPARRRHAARARPGAQRQRGGRLDVEALERGQPPPLGDQRGVRDRDRDAAGVAQGGQHLPVAGRALDLGAAGERRGALDRRARSRRRPPGPPRSAGSRPAGRGAGGAGGRRDRARAAAPASSRRKGSRPGRHHDVRPAGRSRSPRSARTRKW